VSAAYLLSARAVRERSRIVYEAARKGGLAHFTLAEVRLGACADYVVETIRQSYPDLDVPYHSRWRHFEAGGRRLPASMGPRAQVALAVVSVLLDAGAGPDWRYDGLGRSEGLAIASFDWFVGGMPPLAEIGEEALAAAFRAGPHNPMVGIGGRAALLRRLGEVVERRLGGALENLFDLLPDDAGGILEVLLDVLGPIWPGRLTLEGVPLGDAWRHPAIPGDGIVPFHKLSQWLAYSLIEPLERAGRRVGGLDALTGLPEYRNGGLLIDTSVLVPRHPPDGVYPVESELVVEWRALTVALLDEVAAAVRQRLGLSAESFPLAKVLQGGTWTAGRRIARERRTDGAPPIRVASDGTVF
jgi:hypothetical protein